MFDMNVHLLRRLLALVPTLSSPFFLIGSFMNRLIRGDVVDMMLSLNHIAADKI